ncbi:NADPH-dependent glutamate synthase [Candidatus Bathyarchaeota archaeon]|nr:NADPH-dependent glutamate synthase [Candidatus Bathyarchaeota archaeon]
MVARKTAVPMPEQNPKKRVKNFNEVALGYSLGQAVEEAERCLQCKDSPCKTGCPVDVDIPGFIRLIAENRFKEAIEKIKTTNSLPGVCGRVCPQEEQCTKHCTLGKKFEPVAIGRLERFAADYELEGGSSQVVRPKETGKRVAVVGSGPAGLTAAADLAKLGHDVVLFEALHRAGGVLTYGIPNFRLPKELVDAEIDYIRRLGVKLRTDVVVGKTYSLNELLQSFNAVFIGTGAGLPHFTGIPGENLPGVYSANEFLIRSNLMKAYLFPEYDTPIKIGRRVATIGGGNVAMDAARTALRLGAEESMILYRRTEREMPARTEEIEHAKEEGIIFHLLTQPRRILGREGVERIECVKMRLGSPDESGRRRPIPIEGSEIAFDVDIVVVAIGQGPNPLIPRYTPDLKTNKDGTVQIDKKTGMTSIEGVFAGGDIVTGEATVILAMSAGKKAAQSIHRYLIGEDCR